MPSRILLLAASVAALATAANAGDLAAAANDWTGVYVGFGLGGGFGDADLSASGSGSYSDLQESIDAFRSLQCGDNACSGEANSNAAVSAELGEFGLLGRGEIGADYQLERIVFGLNGSYTLNDRSMSARGSGSGDALIQSIPGGLPEYEGDGSGHVESDLNLGNSWSIGGRIGYLLSDSTLLFGSGGYTQMKAKLKSRFTGSAGAGDEESPQVYGISADDDISSSTSEWLNGYYLGAGVETMLFENFSLKFEYRFADYGDIETSAAAGNLDTCQGTCWSAGVESEADITDHSLMATVSFRM